jgi:hypothetical protein
MPELGEMPDCPHCGHPMTPGGVAIGCGPKGSFNVQLPPHCTRLECRQKRDQEAIEDAIARGVIDR